MLIDGYYLDGQTSKRVMARLEVVQASHAYIQLEVLEKAESDSLNNHHLPTSQKLRLEYSDLFIESRLGNTPREIVFHSQQMFVTDDNNGVDNLIEFFHGQQASNDSLSGVKKIKRPSTLIHKIESHLGIIVLSVVATVVLMWGLLAYGLPAAAKSIAFNLPDAASEKFGATLYLLDQTLFDPTELDVQRQQDVQKLLDPYIAQYPDLKVRIHFRSGMAANAFSLPSGDIVFTDDFVELAERDNELVAVFFHELGHLKHRHVLRRAIQGSVLTVVGVLITGDLDTADIVIGVPTLIADMAYSRDFEREADTFAFEALQRNHIPTQEFANIMQRLGEYYADKDGDFPDFGLSQPDTLKDLLSSHPSTQERIERAKHLDAKSAQ